MRTAIRDGVMITTMDDGKANALGFDTIAACREAVAEAGRRRHPLVLTGRNGVFCAGFDLAVMRSGDRELIRALLTEGARLFREMCEAPIPLVAACQGHALAGGALLLLCADQRIGCRKPCRIGLNEVGLGMPLPSFAVALARHRLAATHLSMATMFGYVTDNPESARTIGYLDELAEDPLPAAVEIAQSLADLSAAAFAATKKRVRGPLLERFSALGM